jgi:hypothetical protein
MIALTARKTTSDILILGFILRDDNWLWCGLPIVIDPEFGVPTRKSIHGGIC